jgi:hypothetical protein
MVSDFVAVVVVLRDESVDRFTQQRDERPVSGKDVKYLQDETRMPTNKARCLVTQRMGKQAVAQLEKVLSEQLRCYGGRLRTNGTH